MKSTLVKILLAIGSVTLAVTISASAQPIVAGHYPAGAEGIKGASLPPPGVYFRDYNFFYFANEFKDLPANFEIFAYINAPRVIWMTDLEIFGANYGMDVIVPFAQLDWTFGAASDSHFGLGDIQIEPLLLSWHFKQFDLAAGYAVWVPTGEFDNTIFPPRPDFISKGFWSHMLTLGGTWYPDQEKTWAVSLLNRYEFCHEQEKTHIDPGQVYTAEWGISKSLNPGLDIGLIGYYQQQTTKDSGLTATTKLDRKLGVGPEINAFWPKLKLFTSIRYAYEFEAVERPEGHLVTLTLTKVF
jgi:hypothetical protein